VNTSKGAGLEGGDRPTLEEGGIKDALEKNASNKGTKFVGEVNGKEEARRNRVGCKEKKVARNLKKQIKQG